MAGHSKWATIKRQKAKNDASKGKAFTKIGKEIAVAVKMGGADPDQNSRLRDAIAKAKASNVPNDNIMRSIKKASGELGAINYEEITYEGYGAHGVAVVVETLTDNKNRTAADVRHAFSKGGGALGATGCVLWMFETKGVLTIEKNDTVDEDELMMCALEAGADDFNVDDEGFEITTTPTDFSAVREALDKKGYDFLSVGIEKVPDTTVELSDEQQEDVFKLLDLLDDNDDVQNVYHNAELT